MIKIRKRWIVLGIVVLAVLSVGGWYRYHTGTDEYKARKLVAEMRECFTDSDPGPVQKLLIGWGLMEDKEPRDFDEIERDLLALGAAAVPALIEALEDDDADMRFWAASVLGEIAPVSEKTVFALIDAMKDEDCDVRSITALALETIGPAAEPAIPALAEALKDENFFGGEYVFEQRFSVAVALLEFGRAGEPYLIEALDDEESDVRFAVIRAWMWSETASDEVIASLIRCLKDEDERVRELAAIVLTEFDPEAKVAETVPLLLRAIETKSAFAVEAVDALEKIKTAATDD